MHKKWQHGFHWLGNKHFTFPTTIPHVGILAPISKHPKTDRKGKKLQKFTCQMT